MYDNIFTKLHAATFWKVSKFLYWLWWLTKLFMRGPVKFLTFLTAIISFKTPLTLFRIPGTAHVTYLILCCPHPFTIDSICHCNDSCRLWTLQWIEGKNRWIWITFLVTLYHGVSERNVILHTKTGKRVGNWQPSTIDWKSAIHARVIIILRSISSTYSFVIVIFIITLLHQTQTI